MPMHAFGRFVLPVFFAIQCFLTAGQDVSIQPVDERHHGDFGSSPVEEVISVVEHVITKVTDEGKTEAATYATFACFCRDTTIEISNLIRNGKDSIDVLAADVEEKSADLAWRIDYIQKKQQQQALAEAKIPNISAKCEQAKIKYERDSAEIDKGLSGTRTAFDELEKKKVTDSGLLDAIGDLHIELGSRRHKLDDDWAQKESSCLSLKEALQTEINNCKREILDNSEMRDESAENLAAAKEDLSFQESTMTADQEYLKGVTENCEARARDWDQRTQTRDDELKSLAKALAIMKEKIHFADRVNKRAFLLQTPKGKRKPANKDHASLLQASKDNRTHANNDNASSIQAPKDNRTYTFNSSSSLLRSAKANSTHSLKDRSSLLQAAKDSSADAKKDSDEQSGGNDADVSIFGSAFVASGSEQDLPETDSPKGALASFNKSALPHESRMSVASFLQEVASSSSSVSTALQHSARGRAHSQQEQKMSAKEHQDMAAKQRQRQERALEIVQEIGRRQHSALLASIAMHLHADPFAKVKTLITTTIDRLLEEQRAESDKRSLCQGHMGQKEKLRQERKYRWAEALKLANEVKLLKARTITLEGEISTLGGEIEELVKQMAEQKRQRWASKSANTNSIKLANFGLGAVTECMSIIKQLYARTEGSKARHDIGEPTYSLSQQAPINRVGTYKKAERVADEGYGGRQDYGIYGLLETIKTDFERTIKESEEAEDIAAAEYAEFDRTSKGALNEKKKTKELKEQYLAQTREKDQSIMTEFSDTVAIVDQLNGVLMQMEPICEKTEMNYEGGDRKSVV